MDKLKKMIKNFIQITDHLVDLIALILILSMMSLSGYMLWDSNQVYEKADAKVYEPYMPTRNHSKSFKELQQINSDVIGWLKVNNTHINYPFVQYENDDKYMNTDAEGNYSLSGSIFLHAENNPHFTDFNNIIYGHHMEHGMMFGAIDEYLNEDYFNSHRTGSLVVGKKTYKIRIFAVLECEATEESIFAPTENDNTLNYIKQHALFIDNTALPKDNEKLLGLSTCKYPDTVDRTLIFGALDG